MLTADQIAEFRREHGFILPASSLPLFAEICEQAAMAGAKDNCIAELQASADREVATWRALAERLGEVFDATMLETIDENYLPERVEEVKSLLAEWRAMEASQ
jgi:hypothetical protein